MRGSRSKLKTVAPLAARARSGVLGLRHAEEAQDGDALRQAGHLVGARRVDPDDQPRAGQRAAASGATVAPASAIGGVAERSLVAGAGLDAHLPARADQLLDHVGHEGDTALSGTGLGGDRQFHGRSV